MSRNFGPEASATACYIYATGDAVIGMAADLQDPPELIPQFIKKWEQGNDIVFGIYTHIPNPIALGEKPRYVGGDCH